MTNKMKAKAIERQKLFTRQLIGIKEINGYGVVTYNQHILVFFMVEPSNLSVLSEANLSARIFGLMSFLKGIAEIEILCLNSRVDFEENKRFLRDRMEREDNPVVRKLLKTDITFLDRIQAQTATAREFLIIVRLREEKEKEIFPYLSRVEKALNEQGFMAARADEDDIMRILAVYFEQNVTSESFERFDGARWALPEQI